MIPRAVHDNLPDLGDASPFDVNPMNKLGRWVMLQFSFLDATRGTSDYSYLIFLRASHHRYLAADTVYINQLPRVTPGHSVPGLSLYNTLCGVALETGEFI